MQFQPFVIKYSGILAEIFIRYGIGTQFFRYYVI